MKEPKIPVGVRVFKTKRYFSDKTSDIKYTVKKVKHSRGLNRVLESIGSFFRTLIRNFKHNRDNWFDRANADEGFIIDS